jgi:hypothetical protein
MWHIKITLWQKIKHVFGWHMKIMWTDGTKLCHICGKVLKKGYGNPVKGAMVINSKWITLSCNAESKQEASNDTV